MVFGEKKLQFCIKLTKKEFNVDEKMVDKTKQFPDFDIDRNEAITVGVQGSPSFVVNGVYFLIKFEEMLDLIQKQYVQLYS